MKLVKYALWFIIETVIILLFLAWWWRQKEDDTIKTYNSIKCLISARIEILQRCLTYEKDNKIRNDIPIRIDELNNLMRLLTTLEDEKENENEIKKNILR